jgi:hypothetical protein
MAELAARLRETADADLRELARDLLVGVTVDERDLNPWADLMDEAAARIASLEAALAAERQTATFNAETHTRAIRALEDMVEAEAEARREAEGECERLTKAIAEIQRRTSLLVMQNTGRWDMRVEKDRRTRDVIGVNQEIASEALAPPAPSRSET